MNDPDFLNQAITRFLQQFLEAEITSFLQAEPYQRTSDRTGYRNGYKPRVLKTRVGRIELSVPQDREGRFSSELFSRFQRSEKALILALQEAYLQGVSTRKVTKITEALCGTSVSKSHISHHFIYHDVSEGSHKVGHASCTGCLESHYVAGFSAGDGEGCPRHTEEYLANPTMLRVSRLNSTAIK